MKLYFWLLLTAVLAGCSRQTAVETAAQPQNYVLIDVRSHSEFAAGHLAGARNMPHDKIAELIVSEVPQKDRAVYLYCRSGRRVKTAVSTLQKLNYTNIYDLGGISDAAKKLDLPITK